jgi:hypothetical protein
LLLLFGLCASDGHAFQALDSGSFSHKQRHPCFTLLSGGYTGACFLYNGDMENPQLSIAIHGDGAGFTVTREGGGELSVSFAGVAGQAVIGAADGAVSFWAGQGVRATVFQDGGGVTLALSRDTLLPLSFATTWAGMGDIQPTDSGFGGEMGGVPVNVSVFDGRLIQAEGDSVVWQMSGADMRLEITAAEQETFSMLSTTVTYVAVAAGQQPPSFAVSVYDDSGYTRPRPVRIGAPVISTVPTYGSNLATDELVYYGTGSGAPTRVMYFQAICNMAISSAIPVELQVALPSGLDTVSLPINVPMTFVSSTAYQTIYRCSYTFSQEDTINFVDGYTYINAYLPLSVQVGLPMRLSVSSTAAMSGQVVAVPQDASTFSIGEPIVDPPIAPDELEPVIEPAAAPEGEPLAAEAPTDKQAARAGGLFDKFRRRPK